MLIPGGGAQVCDSIRSFHHLSETQGGGTASKEDDCGREGRARLMSLW